jgi:hypothetical protein
MCLLFLPGVQKLFKIVCVIHTMTAGYIIHIQVGDNKQINVLSTSLYSSRTAPTA